MSGDSYNPFDKLHTWVRTLDDREIDSIDELMSRAINANIEQRIWTPIFDADLDDANLIELLNYAYLIASKVDVHLPKRRGGTVTIPSGYILCIGDIEAAGNSFAKLIENSIILAATDTSDVILNDSEREEYEVPEGFDLDTVKFVTGLTWPVAIDMQDVDEGKPPFTDMPIPVYLLAMALDMEPSEEDRKTIMRMFGEVPTLDAIRPNRHYVPNSKVSQVLTSPALFRRGGAGLNVGSKPGQLQIDFGLTLTDDAESSGISLSKDGQPLTSPIDREDVRVIAAIVTLKNAGNRTVSPFQIADTMGYRNPSVDLQEEIHHRVMKLRGIDGRIDWTAQARKWGILNPETGKPFEHAEITGHLVDCIVFEGRDESGARYVRYQILSDPITYQHARQVKQVIDYPQSLKALRPIREDGREVMRVTREQAKLIDEILWFVYSEGTGSSINYDTLFERAEVDVSTSRRRQTAVAFVNNYLRALQGRGVITGFVPEAVGSSHRLRGFRVIMKKLRRRGNHAVE